MLSKLVFSLLAISVGSAFAAPIAAPAGEIEARDIAGMDLEEMPFEKRSLVEDVSGGMDVFERGLGEDDAELYTRDFDDDLEKRALTNAVHKAMANHHDGKAQEHRGKQVQHQTHAENHLRADMPEMAREHAKKANHHGNKAREHETKAASHRSKIHKRALTNAVHKAMANHHDGKAQEHRGKQVQHQTHAENHLRADMPEMAREHAKKANHHGNKAREHETKAASHRSKIH